MADQWQDSKSEPVSPDLPAAPVTAEEAARFERELNCDGLAAAVMGVTEDLALNGWTFSGVAQQRRGGVPLDSRKWQYMGVTIADNRWKDLALFRRATPASQTPPASQTTRAPQAAKTEPEVIPGNPFAALPLDEDE